MLLKLSNVELHATYQFGQHISSGSIYMVKDPAIAVIKSIKYFLFYWLSQLTISIAQNAVIPQRWMIGKSHCTKLSKTGLKYKCTFDYDLKF